MNALVRFSALAACLLSSSPWALSDMDPEHILRERYKFWEANAPICKAGDFAFPTKSSSDPKQPCDDGDMTMFNGLLCFAGDERGCQGVIDAQDPATGQWFRSPRIRLLGYNDRGDASFSPDMALGIELYLINSGDIVRALKWAVWLTDLPSHDFSFQWGNWLNYLSSKSVAWFCREQPGCIIRPSDAASLAMTFEYLHDEKGMPDLPHGSLRGTLATWKGTERLWMKGSTAFNKPGYSQHLLAVEILLQRTTQGDSDALKKAALDLAGKQENEGNAFFSHLAGRDRHEVIRQTLERCPSPSNLPTPPLFQWQWERDTPDQAWKHSAYWDCIFMAKLLGI
ncbi:hypothetical protein ACCS54_18905 [Rhizobium johnstonii]|uniref:hypothetical protein n=1 Tax=Rhizobium johnstonii TaxID=3019933 RepID=UPI003F98E08E